MALGEHRHEYEGVHIFMGTNPVDNRKKLKLKTVLSHLEKIYYQQHVSHSWVGHASVSGCMVV